jgi:hypothetical protein
MSGNGDGKDNPASAMPSGNVILTPYDSYSSTRSRSTRL